MKTRRKGILPIVVVICILLLGAIGIFALFGGSGELEPLDTSVSVASTTQNGDTIAFNPDGTYVIQGDVEIQGAVFAYEVKGTYAVNDGKLVLNEQNPTVYVDSKFGAFDLPGDIWAEIVDGALVIHLEASNESATFELAHFILGKEFAQMLGITGVTAGDWEDEPTQETEAEPTEEVTEPVLDAEGALLTVESAGNKIAFYPDDTFKLVGRFILEDSGLSVEYFYELTDTYSVEDGALVLPEKATTLLNSDLFASYDYVDVETPSRCTAEIVDGLLELRFFIQVDSGEVEIAVFKLGKEDAEKIGVTGAEGDTVIEEEPEETKPTGGNNAPSQPSIPSDAKPLSYSSGGYTITFYSNGQYKQTGSVYVAGNTVSVSVTDTYTINEEGNLVIRTSNQVSCYVSGYNLSFGAPNNSSCNTYGDGYKVSFDVYANGQNYHVGSVNLSADDVKQIQQNYGLEGETPDPEYSYIADTSKTVISFNKEEGTFSISGEGTLLIDGAENDLTFTVSDTYTVAENGTATAANSANALSYKITLSGQTQEANATPDVTIVKSGENYNITLKITMFEEVFTLAEGTVSVGDIVIDDSTEQPEEPTPTGISATSNGITLSFYPSNNTFDLIGESKMGETVLATYSLSAPGTYTIENNVLKLSNVTLVVESAYAPGTFDIPGDQITVAANDDGTLSVTFPIGEPPVVFTYTKEQAEQIGLDMDAAEEPEVPELSGISATSNGITLAFDPSSNTYNLAGESKMGETVLATYSLSAPGTYTIEDNVLKLSNVTLVVASDYAPGTFDIPGDQIAVAVNEDGTLSVTFPIGEPPVVFTYTKEQAEQIGLDMDAVEEPEVPAYTPDESKTVITFNKENGFFTISGAGKFTVSGMEADLTFTAADLYTVSEDGTVTAANTADALGYTVTMFGQSEEAKTTPVTSIVKDGDNYKVTLTATVNGQTLTLAEGTVSADDVIKSEEPEAPAYTPDTSKTVISFNKENGFFTISGAGKFTVSGMEADLTFTAADTYTVAEDGAVTAANTAGALAYTVTMFGQSEEAKATPVTSIVKDGDNYKVTLTATVNGQSLMLAEGTVSADDVVKSEEPAAPAYTPDTSKTVISFNKENGFFTISGAGKFAVSGMEADLTFTAADTYTVAEDGAVTATNTADALSYTVTILGQPAEAKTTPVTSIVKDGDNYKVTLAATVNGQTLTLAEGTVSADDVVESEEPEAPAYTPDTSKTVISFNKENGFFTISGAGKFAVSGMEADLTFTAADLYTVSEDGTVTVANTADALVYTVTMFGQSEEATATPVTSIVKDGDNYKITLTATVNGQTLTLAEGTVSADDVVESEEPEAPAYTPDTSKTVISFNKENGFFTISGAGKFAVSGMEADLTFTAADLYTVSEDGTVTAANTADALGYTVTMFGQSEEAKTTPVTSIVKDGDNYKVTLIATVNGQTLTLAEGTVSAEDVIKSEEPEAPAITYSSAAESITFNAEGKSFSANGSGTLSAMGMDMAITFTLNDSYAVAEDGTVTATNTPGALSYSVLGAPGSSNPITSITQSGDSYRIVISTEISGFGTVTLLDETVNASNVVVNEVASVSEEEVLEDDGVEENSEENLTEEETDSEDPPITGTQDVQAEENPDDSVSDGAETPETEADSDATEETTDTTTSDRAESENDAAEEVTDITESSETDSDTAEETTDTTTSDGTDTEGTVPENADVSTEVE